MPSSSGKPRPDAYFTSLAALDSSVPAKSDDQVIPYIQSRLKSAQGKDRRQLLVCHDYKVNSSLEQLYKREALRSIIQGGYKEDYNDHSYTFNFWQYCDTFI